MSAYHAKTGNYTTVSSCEDYRRKWTVFALIPREIYICLSREISVKLNAKYDEFQELGVQILPISRYTKFSQTVSVETPN